MAQTGDIALDDRARLPEQVPAKLPLPAAWQPERKGGLLAGLRQAAARALEYRRLFLLLPYAMIAGLVVAFELPADPQPLLLGTGAAVAMGALALSRRSLAWSRAAGLVAAFWLGFCLLSLHGAWFGTQMLARPAYGTYEVRVDEVLTANSIGVRAIVSGVTPVYGARAVPVRRARLVVAGVPDLAPGDRIRGRVRFYPVPGPVVPNGFDTQFHAYFDGIGAYGSTIGKLERVSAGDAAAPERIVDGVRRAIAGRIDAALPQPAAGIARALITGDQSAVTEQAREVMAAAGLAHVLSVSGLHLTLVAMLVMAALRGGLALAGGFDRFVSVKRLAALGAIVASLGYFGISGGNVAALRSTIMIVLVLGAVVAGRRALTMRNVAIAALLIIVSDPASVFRPSFQLSFAAVVALIGAWEMIRPRDERRVSWLGRVREYFVGGAITSLVAGAATLLFSIYHFQQTAPLGVLGNLMSLVLIGFVMMPMAVVATLLMPFGVEAPFLVVMGWSIDGMIGVARIVAEWSAGISASPLLLPVALVLGLAPAARAGVAGAGGMRAGARPAAGRADFGHDAGAGDARRGRAAAGGRQAGQLCRPGVARDLRRAAGAGGAARLRQPRLLRHQHGGVQRCGGERPGGVLRGLRRGRTAGVAAPGAGRMRGGHGDRQPDAGNRRHPVAALGRRRAEIRGAPGGAAGRSIVAGAALAGRHLTA